MPDELAPFRPATIANRQTWDRLATDPRVEKLLDPSKPIEPTMPLPTAADYLAAHRSNDRGRLDDHWRKTRPKFARLVVNRLLKGIDAKDPDDRLLNWLFAFVNEPTWVVSAHLPNNDLPLSGAGQLDLAGCEAAGELAEAREVLLPWIESNSGTLATTIVRELDRRVLTSVMNEPQWWSKEDAKRSDARRLNNWTGVCAGSILTTCLSLEAGGLPRPECRDKMTRLLRTYFDVAFSESGECDEGIDYWNYGIEFAVLGMSRLSTSQLRDGFDLDRVKQVASYPERAHLVGRLFFVGNDGVPLADCSPVSTPWLAELVDSDFLRWWSAQAKPKVRTVPHWLRLLQRDGSHSTTQPAAPKHEPTRLLADQQAAIFQRPTDRGLFTFTITGGNNDELHNHNDLGTFQLFLDDQGIVPDLGSPEYVTDYFNDATRYTKYLVAASGGHCCPAINGVEQRASKEAAAKLLAWRPDSGEVALDLTSAYPPEARLKRWTRAAHVPADDAVAIVTDEFELEADGRLVHRIWFVDEPRISDGGATIEVPSSATVTIEPRPDAVDVLKIEAGDPKLMLRAYPKKKLLYRVDLTYRAGAGKMLAVHTKLALAKTSS